MNTIKDFESLNTDVLATVEGGVCKPVLYGANGYGCQDSKTHQWRYVVTKGNVQATVDTVVKGWMNYGPWIPRR
ncbi:garvicin Q family class II bacteriocin [Streptococcus hyointestinalis]|nr:garvicin Q family class II bacteriocin [Streptococcus hyointestinalis]MCI6871769.1 garvicin Q family class II bacteriocin [Streptococcus hyointestinalis]